MIIDDTNDDGTPIKSVVVGVYNVSLAYGGPEEGGWWYDAGNLVRVMRVFRSPVQARAYRDRLNRRLDATLNKGLPPRSSVISRGTYEALAWANNAPAGFPDQRPHYE